VILSSIQAKRHWQYTVCKVGCSPHSCVSGSAGYFRWFKGVKSFKIKSIKLVFLNLDMVEVPSSNLGSPTKEFF
jgi:hypothetical protein